MQLKSVVFSLVTAGLLGALSTATACDKNECVDGDERYVEAFSRCYPDVTPPVTPGDDEDPCSEQMGAEAQQRADCAESVECGADVSEYSQNLENCIG